jgi:hypothetical protein
MNQKTRILVLAVAKPYDMIPEGSLERVSGCSMQYVMTDDVSRIQYDEDTGEVGYIPAKEKMPKEFYDIAKNYGLPAYADAVFGMKSSGGKNVFVIKKLDFLENETAAPDETTSSPAAKAAAVAKQK